MLNTDNVLHSSKLLRFQSQIVRNGKLNIPIPGHSCFGWKLNVNGQKIGERDTVKPSNLLNYM